MKEDLPDQSNQVKESLKDSNLEQAIQLIIEFLPRLNGSEAEQLSKAGIGIFNLLGSQHPLTKEYRRKFDMVLWK